jgi:hypothetical protein
MRSLFAVLRSLVLPAGATTGTRIVLDGVNGRIEVYDASDDLIIRIDGTDGVVLFDASGADRLQLTKPSVGFGSPIVISSGAAGEVQPAFISTNTGSFSGQDVLQLAISAPEIGADNLSLRIFSVEDPALAGEAALFLVDSTALDGPGHVFYDFANNSTFDNTDGGVVVSDDFWIGDSLGNAGQPPTQRQSLPRGVLDIDSGNANVGPTSGTTELTLRSVTATVAANRRIRLHGHIRSIAYTVDTDAFALRWKESTTTLNELSVPPHGIAAADKAGWEFIHYVDAPSAGSHTYNLVLVRLTGTGTATAEAGATFPMQAVMEDVGGT